MAQIRQLHGGGYARVITYGCQQNENDSERLKGMLAEMGYALTEDDEQADIILFNTCAVREGAELKVYGNLGALKHLKKRRPQLVIGVCGCMMQQKKAAEQVKAKYRHVDLVFGTHALWRFPELLHETLSGGGRVVEVEDSEGRIIENLPVYRAGAPSAWVSVMYGCNNFCSYCIVPYVRGRERSRKPKDILQEIELLVESGVREITLLGQNVNSYGKDLEHPMAFADLLREVNRIDGLRRIRFMTSHPKDVTGRLIDAMADCEKVCSQLHLPFQAGSDRILSAMNRRYTKQQYLELVQRVRERMPDTAFTSDVIVGFPGETDDDFNQTIDVLEQVRFDSVFSFIYSKRDGTPAAEMPDPFTREDKQAHFDRLLEVQNRISLEINRSYLGRVCEVMVEGASKTDRRMLTGRTSTGKIINFPDTGAQPGEFILVRVTQCHTWSLLGEAEENKGRRQGVV